MEEFKKTVAQNLIRLRKEKQYTQLQLADLLHYSDKAVSKWERGESLPDLYVLKQIADLYHVSMDDLVLTEEEQAEKAAKHTLELENAERASEESVKESLAHTRGIIAAMAILLVWLIATLAFVALDTFVPHIKYSKLMFLYALPITAIVWLVFNSIWFNRRRNYLIISVLMWSILTTLFITFWAFHPWKIFCLGIPGQVIIFLWSRMHIKK